MKKVDKLIHSYGLNRSKGQAFKLLFLLSFHISISTKFDFKEIAKEKKGRQTSQGQFLKKLRSAIISDIK